MIGESSVGASDANNYESMIAFAESWIPHRLVVCNILEYCYMLDHVSITVTDIDAAEKFYDATMSALSVPKVRKSEVRLGYGERCDGDYPDRTYLSIKLGGEPDDAPARHWCFKAPSRAAVDAFWKSGIENGGTDNGPPGIREIYHATYYAAFLIDPSGNRVEAVCHSKVG
jgi:catechol 2,3-dioxygenase-like lactoylglutathione lyase family enzyme